MKHCIDCGAELEDDARFCSDCGAPQPEIADEEDVQAEETLPAVMGARVVGTLHRAVRAAGGAKFLGRVADENDATVVCREEQFKCCLPRDARYRVSEDCLDNCFVDPFVEYSFGETSINPDASAMIMGLDVPDSSIVKKIIIPSKIEGLPVVGIANEAFKELPALEEVTLPDSIVKIGDRAFLGCTNLKSINLSKSLSGMLDLAFDGFTTPDRFTSSGFPYSSTFEGCTSLSLKSRSLLRKAGYIGEF